MPVDPKNPLLAQDQDAQQKLQRWRSEFQLDYAAFNKWRENKKMWERFYDGDQLSDEEKRALKARGQPEVVVNLIKPRIDGVLGDYLGRRVMMRARDRGSSDFDKAKHITEAIRYIEDMNRFDEQEAKVGEDMLIGGIGWYKILLDFDFLEAEIRVSHRNNNDVIPDRRSRRLDMRDGKRLWETVWVEVEDLKELYPTYEKEIEEAASIQMESFDSWLCQNKDKDYRGDDYDLSTTNVDGINFETFLDPKRRRIRVINCWEREQKRIEFAFHPAIQGSVQEITDLDSSDRKALRINYPGVQTFTRVKWNLNSGIFIVNAIIEDKVDVRPHDSEGKFPFIRAIAHIEKEDSLSPYGMVKQYVDPQKEYNKRRSKLLHKSNTNRIVAEEGAIADGNIEKIRREASRPDGVVLYKAGKQFQIQGGEPAQADVLLLQLAQSEIDAAGVSKEFVGQEDSSISGRAVNLREVYGQKILRPYYASLRYARKQVFEIILEEMQQYWTSEKLIKITDDPTAGQIILNQRATDPITGRPVILNNLRLGKYDIKIDEDVETPNQRQEIFNNLLKLGEVSLKAGQPFPLEMLIKSSDLPNKQEWLDAIAQRQVQQMQVLQAQAIAGAAQAGKQQNGQ